MPMMQFFWDKFGRCGRCMRTSLRAAAMSWLLTLTLAWFGLYGWLISATFSAALTLLWFAHVSFYAWRFANRKTDEPGLQPTADFLTRRGLMRDGLKAAAAAVLVSFAFPEVSRADHCANPGWHICTGNPNKCCAPGMNTACPYNKCTGVAGKCYRVVTDDDAYYVRSCCDVFYAC
jgi:hypothetical protein